MTGPEHMSRMSSSYPPSKLNPSAWVLTGGSDRKPPLQLQYLHTLPEIRERHGYEVLDIAVTRDNEKLGKVSIFMGCSYGKDDREV